jgi:hypothetical protein
LATYALRSAFYRFRCYAAIADRAKGRVFLTPTSGATAICPYCDAPNWTPGLEFCSRISMASLLAVVRGQNVRGGKGMSLSSDSLKAIGELTVEFWILAKQVSEMERVFRAAVPATAPRPKKRKFLFGDRLNDCEKLIDQLCKNSPNADPTQTKDAIAKARAVAHKRNRLMHAHFRRVGTLRFEVIDPNDNSSVETDSQHIRSVVQEVKDAWRIMLWVVPALELQLGICKDINAQP